MFLFQKMFQKKRGRKPKKNIFKSILYWSVGIIISFIVIPLLLLSSIFSEFLFFIPHTSTLLGDEKNNKTYLITLHNEGEIRPELGFLTSFAFVTLADGKLNFEFHDSYDVEPAPEKILAPDAIEKRFSSAKKYAGWTFRDSNFFLDHPQNAEKIIEFLQYDARYAQKNFDGVISLDLYAIGQIIDSVGGIELEGETLTSKNIFSLLEAKAKDFDHHSEEEWKNRKNSLSPLASILMKKIIFSPLHWKNFSSTLSTLLHQKHILLFFTDPKIQKDIEKKQWAGKIFLPEKSIVLGTNIANIGGRKGDRYIRKQFFSTFLVSPRGKITEKFRIKLQHEGTRTLYSDRYFAEIRILRNKGTKLKNSSLDLQKISSSFDQDKNLEIFSFGVEIDPGEDKNFSFEFSVPQKLKPNNPPLQVFSLHQAGVITQQNFVTFQGSGNTSFGITGCDTTQKTENITQCLFADTQDISLFITQNPDTQLPLLERSEWTEDGKKVEIVFSELIDPVLLGQVLIREKISGTPLQIQNIRNDEKKIIITFVTPQERIDKKIGEKKFFSLLIENLSDRHGNTREIFRTTVVRD